MVKLMISVYLLLVHFQVSLQQSPSPCPSIFTYEPRGTELDRWYGRIILSTADEIYGIRLSIRLDSTAELLGNWFGETSTKNNQHFMIKNPNYRLQPNVQPLSVRFYVKYNENGRIPSVSSILLNGRVICLKNNEVESTPVYVSIIEQISSQAQPPRSETVTKSDQGTTLYSTRISFEKTVTCGAVRQAARPLITNGGTTIAGQWPWHVAIYRVSDINLSYICGGSLISTEYVLTAAHCVTHNENGTSLSLQRFVIYLGKYNLYQLGANVKNLQLSQIFVHPSYNKKYYHNDIAILKLEQAVEITDFVNPVCLWEEHVELDAIVNKSGVVVGWGYNENDEFSENLTQAMMPVVSTEKCFLSNPNFFPHFMTEKSFCAGDRNGTTACPGDSGGGMVFPKSTGNVRNPVWQLRGIVSVSSVSRNNTHKCDTSDYIIFTDVAKHLEWIKTTIKLT